MKRIFTLFALFIFIFNSTAQHVDYENDSRWFLGLNMGGTWNTTDVKNKTYLGAGFIIGKQFNYNYGRRTSFDIRFRYLGGNWYGQDYDTTMLANYNPAFMPADYQHYKNNPGFTVNNFRTRVHELGLELALHANGLRERSGWDPYIFGGINLAWNQTTSDLINIDSSFFTQGYYDYAADGNEAAINSMLDGDYETAMNAGSELSGWNVDFVPSIGFGIGYQVGPRFSLGLEHKTSFALKNDWDGFESPDMKWGIFKNDIYHYSGGYLRFHFRAHGNVNTNIDNQNNNQNNLTNQPCPTPDIRVTRPATNGTVVDQQLLSFSAQVSNISSRDNVILRLNGQATSNFFYTQTSNTIEANLLLVEGVNNIEIVASNACGQDAESISVTYQTCSTPVIAITQPAYNNLTVDQARQVVRATITNGATGVTMSVNGVSTSNFFYNQANGSLESNLALQQGANTVQIIATNDCGTDTETITINYSNCTNPVVVFGTANGTTVNSATFSYAADVQNVTSNNDIVVRLNGVNQTFTYNASTKRLSGIATLRQGANTIEIIASNACGSQNQVISVNYEIPCIQPTITMVTPVGSTQTQATTQLIKATITEVNALNQIQLKVNGVVVAGGAFNASTKVYTHTVNLQEGANNIELIATNNCGAVSQPVIVNKSTCQLPIIGLVSPATNNFTAQSASLAFQVTLSGVTNTNQVTLMLNDANVSSGATLTNGAYRKSLTLQSGNNVIVVTATNNCGSVTQTFNVSYTPCLNPVISNMSPVSGTQVTNATVQVSATVANVQAANNIQLVVNGTVAPGGSFNAQTGLFTQNVNLVEGSNSIQLIATSACGTDQKTISVTYNAPCDLPVITLVNPQSTTLTTDQGSLSVQATISGVTQNQVAVKVNGRIQSGGTLNAQTGAYSIRVTLTAGTNEIVITATNNCGTVSQTIMVNYEPCIQPVVTLIAPLNNYQTEQTSVQVVATVLNVTGLNEITLKVNGVIVQGGSYNAATKQYQNMVNLQVGANTIQLTAQTNCGSAMKSVTVQRTEPVVDTPEEMITICHRPPGNPENTQELTIPLSAWPAHQAHGDVLGPCPQVENNEEEESNEDNLGNQGGNPREMITICHRPPGNPENTQELTIPLSAWPAHQAHGDVLGPCPAQNGNNNGGNSQGNNGNSNNGNNGGNENEMITICHRPPGNPENTQELTIPLSAWPAHQAHGDVLGPCPAQNGNNNGGNSQGSNGNSNNGNNGGNSQGNNGNSNNGNNGGNSNNGGNQNENQGEVETEQSGNVEEGNSGNAEGESNNSNEEIQNENNLNGTVPVRPRGEGGGSEGGNRENQTPPKPGRRP